MGIRILNALLETGDERRPTIQSYYFRDVTMPWDIVSGVQRLGSLHLRVVVHDVKTHANGDGCQVARCIPQVPNVLEGSGYSYLRLPEQNSAAPRHARNS